MSTKPSVRMVLTVDTEPDNVWSDFRSAGLQNVLRLERFHEVMTRLHVRPTYLLTYSVASDADSVKALLRLPALGPCEFGAHLHAWETPPFLASGMDREHAVFAHDLPLDHFREKLKTLTGVIAAHFGPPASYRAGRFGFTAAHIAVLEEQGYRVDSSVTPLLDRRGKYGLPRRLGGVGGRDYRRAPLEPYHPNYAIDIRPGSARLLEVPVTAGPLKPASRLIMAAHRHGPRLMRRIMARLGVSRVIHASLPETSWPDLQALLGAALARGRKVFNFMLHSSETMPGGAPWVRSEEHVREILDRTRRCIEYLSQQTVVEFRTLTELASEWTAHGSESIPQFPSEAQPATTTAT